jgi:hypothetical protein
LAFPRGGRRIDERLKLVNDGAKNVVVLQEFRVNLGDLLEDLGVRPEKLALFDEGANDIHAHRHGPFASQHVSGLQRTMLGEGVGQDICDAVLDQSLRCQIGTLKIPTSQMNLRWQVGISGLSIL